MDLGLVKKKLMATKYHGGQEWGNDLANEAIGLYKKYLVLCGLYPKARLVPTKDIDIVWHTHILDTNRYHEDCHKIFGYFLHHNPNYSPEIVGGAIYQRSSRLTVELFKKHFNQEPTGEHMLCSGFPCDPGECSS